jgi:hypothetical protein
MRRYPQIRTTPSDVTALPSVGSATVAAGTVRKKRGIGNVTSSVQSLLAPLAVAGGGVSLVLADATHAHAADSVVLTSDTALSIAASQHAHAADSIVLTFPSAGAAVLSAAGVIDITSTSARPQVTFTF